MMVYGCVEVGCTRMEGWREQRVLLPQSGEDQGSLFKFDDESSWPTLGKSIITGKVCH